MKDTKDSDSDGVPDIVNSEPTEPLMVEDVEWPPPTSSGPDEMWLEEGKIFNEPTDLVIIKVKNNRITSSSTTQGNVVYKIPKDMTVRTTYQVIVRISKSTLNIYENLNGEVKTSSIPITETMEVKLIDVSPSDRKMFDIIADNSAVQLVENGEEVTQWSWNITPIRSGKSKLKVVVSVIRNGITKETVYVDDVSVKADVSKSVPLFIGNYWQWLFSTLLLPIFYWLYAKRKKKKAKE
jgi:hypothetical protein